MAAAFPTTFLRFPLLLYHRLGSLWCYVGIEHLLSLLYTWARAKRRTYIAAFIAGSASAQTRSHRNLYAYMPCSASPSPQKQPA